MPSESNRLKEAVVCAEKGISMKKLTILAPAKINLTLDVLARRADGYHELSTVMQAISLADTVMVEAERSHETVIELTCDKPFVPTDERNIAVKAAKAFLEKNRMKAHIRITLQKRIPVGAGMGGGSTDAAAVLRALDTLLPSGMTPDEMVFLAKSIGADVPFVLRGGCALAEGIGEALQPIPVYAGIPIVVCKPRVSASTKEIFTRLKVDSITEHPDTLGAVDAIRERNLDALAFRLFNVLESVTTEICPVIGEYRRELLKAGALGAAMTGSGTAVFGVFSDKASASCAAAALRHSCDQVWLAETIGENPAL